MLKVHSFERGFLWVAHCGSEIFKSKNPPQRNEENQLQGKFPQENEGMKLKNGWFAGPLKNLQV